MNSAGLAPSDPTTPSERRAAEIAESYSHEPAPGLPTQPDRRAAASIDHPLPPVDAALAASTEPGPILASGATADVFALDDLHVLRRYRSGGDASSEVHLLRHVVAHGFPAPAVLQASGPDLVMERLHGPTLLQALGAGEVSLSDAAGIMHDLHTRLHAIPAPDGWGPNEREAWPQVSSGPVVVHLDLHPGNVFLTESHGPALVDWANARAGTAELDVSLTALIIAEVAVDAGGVYSQAARALLAAFLVATDIDPLVALAEAAELRALDPSLVPGERELVPAAAVLVGDLVDVTAHP
ncbi:aminoglycoside phosphotransferase family protein [Cellulomonas sp. Leaf395]|uniref:aminoglycoside phosphotransferase family protein n=1 Tax=Cellulomonas sp. Leaf395 TaxID=1736362 RepID=UPI0006F8F618|nr:aminoglycoside phosphotransferase family protein [Cellulomonas sp. Leaf395]KQS98710.1 serine/threonine protein kinase [Cellulomonas sp. Leaf395]